MKKNPFYSLQMISGTPRLLPFGQAVASQRPGVRLGGSGELIWSLIDQCADTEELIRLAVSRLDISGPEKTEAEADMRQFILDLEAMGILDEDNSLTHAARRESRFSGLKAGPMSVELRGAADLFHPDFAPFLSPYDDSSPADQTVSVTCTLAPDHAGMSCLLHNSELEVYQGGDRIIMRFPTMSGITACALSRDGGAAVFHVSSSADIEELRRDLFHAIRHAVLYRAQRLGFFALHAVSVLYRDRAWLFSAPAGTGKSTHAELWHSRFGTPVLNGDLAMLSITDRGPLFHPIPWCGTSGISLNETRPLGGITFLRRGEINSAALIASESRQLRLSNRIISPVWTESQLEENLGFAAALSAHTAMWELTCTPEPEAAVCMKAAIDRYLEEEQING